MSENTFKPQCRRQNIVIQEFENEILLYELKTNRAFCLNETSALVWRACDGTKNVAQISDEISAFLKIPVGEDLVWLALEQLKKDDLIECDFQSPFKDVSRRELIRRAGLASMVALPVISSLVAPVAAYAQSNCFGDNNSARSGINCTCNSASDCQSNCCGTSATGNVCVTSRLKATGSSCRAGCECASNSCPTGASPRVCA